MHPPNLVPVAPIRAYAVKPGPNDHLDILFE
jgi:hypothetical protein